jgi:hypothetical protein
VKSKEKLMKALLLVVLVGAMAACAADSSRARVQTAESSAGVAFANYHTFGFRPAEQPAAPFEVSARSFEVERRMRPLIVAELLGKGYAEQAGQTRPDFMVAFGLGYAQDAVPSVDQTGGAGPAAAAPIERGKIAIDAFDTSSAAQVWHGTAEAEVNPKTIDDQLLRAAVHQLLAPFPSRAIAVTSAQAP